MLSGFFFIPQDTFSTTWELEHPISPEPQGVLIPEPLKVCLSPVHEAPQWDFIWGTQPNPVACPFPLRLSSLYPRRTIWERVRCHSGLQAFQHPCS